MSWLTDIFHAFVNGAIGEGVPSHDESKPLGAALNVMNTAATNLGNTLSGAAVTGVDAFLEAHVGNAGTEVANLALEALIAEAQKRLGKPAQAAPPAPPPE